MATGGRQAVSDNAAFDIVPFTDRGAECRLMIAKSVKEKGREEVGIWVTGKMQPQAT